MVHRLRVRDEISIIGLRRHGVHLFWLHNCEMVFYLASHHETFNDFNKEAGTELSKVQSRLTVNQIIWNLNDFIYFGSVRWEILLVIIGLTWSVGGKIRIKNKINKIYLRSHFFCSHMIYVRRGSMCDSPG